MNTIEEAFSFQIKSGTPCDGDYLGGKTLDQYVEFVSVTTRSLGGKPPSDDEVKERILETIAEWKKHEGAYMLFFMNASNAEQLTVQKVWSDELPDMEGKWEIVVHDNKAMPRLRKIA